MIDDEQNQLEETPNLEQTSPPVVQGAGVDRLEEVEPEETAPQDAPPENAQPENAQPDAALSGDDSAAREAQSPLDKLNVKVDFQIGSITLPVKALSNLAPGWTLSDMPHMTFPKVLAFSAGRAFAEGELIEIDGKIGFRITALLP